MYPCLLSHYICFFRTASFLQLREQFHIQVEAALLGDPDNEELQKLKTDLEEVIALQVWGFSFV